MKTEKIKKCMAVIGLIIVGLILITNLTGFENPIINGQKLQDSKFNILNEEKIPKPTGLTSHAQINIDGNSDLANSPAVNGGGDGSYGSPYIMENYLIDASEGSVGAGIKVQNTDKYVVIRNCVIVNGSSAYQTRGIYLNNCTNVNISGNLLFNNYDGIQLYSSSNNTLSGNNASFNDYYGIRLGQSSNNMLSGNNASFNDHYGISLLYLSNYNMLSGNTASFTIGNGNGITLGQSSNNTLSGNTASFNNNNGISLSSSSNNTLSGNNASFNANPGIIVFSSSNNNTLSGNNASFNAFYGIKLSSSSNNTLFRNTVNNNSGYGIYLQLNNFNTLSENNASFNDQNGIGLYSSSNNMISGNNASFNGDYGIFLLSSSNNNMISGNNASFNGDYGIYLVTFSSGNRIWENIFMNNSNSGESQAYDGVSTDNQWYLNGKGNYWGDFQSRYPEASHDGIIWDIPYEIDGTGNCIDMYPLIGDIMPISNFTVINYLISESGLTLFSFSFIGKTGNNPTIFQWNFGDGSPNVSIENPTHQFMSIGEFTVTLTLTDFNGDISVFCQTVIRIPDASFIKSASKIIKGEYISFSYTGLGGETPLSFDWNFGDGSPNVTIENSTHQFMSVGEFTVTLTVTDFNGIISISHQTVKVYNNISTISIDGNSALSDFCSVGDGSFENPYIIEWYFIEKSSIGINIQNTDLYLIIQNCWIEKTTEKGIGLSYCENVKILNNEVLNNSRGISLSVGGLNNIISGNMIINNSWGIILEGANNNNISGNTIINNYDGIYMGGWGSSNNIISGNIIANNTNCGINLCYLFNTTISGNIITNNFGDGIYLGSGPYNNTILGNTINNNGYRGIYLGSGSYNNILGNNISYNDDNGIYLLYSDNNNISGNILSYNHNAYPWVTTGMEMNHANNNIIWLNNFFDGLFIQNSENILLDNGQYGNYWEDYTTKYPSATNDGLIWNTPYDLIDHFPLVNIVEDWMQPTIIGQENLIISEGDLGNQIQWTINEENPDEYYIYRNGTLIEDGIYSNGQIITFNVDGLSRGEYTFTLWANDTFPQYASDEIIVTVIDGTLPILTNPADLTFNEGSIGNEVVWTANDLNPTTYSISNNSVT
ncbi:MAG: NosD domain-containing protein, partial [Promethearchaeota archaeon]